MSEWKIGNCCYSNCWGRGLVMVESEAIRNNRLALLDGIAQLFLRIADVSKLTYTKIKSVLTSI